MNVYIHILILQNLGYGQLTVKSGYGILGVKNLGYGILGVKNLGYGILGGKNLGYGIWAPLCHPPPIYGAMWFYIMAVYNESYMIVILTVALYNDSHLAVYHGINTKLRLYKLSLSDYDVEGDTDRMTIYIMVLITAYCLIHGNCVCINYNYNIIIMK